MPRSLLDVALFRENWHSDRHMTLNGLHMGTLQSAS